MPPPRNITILGAGLTGLASAHHLSRLLPSTSRITLLDSTDRLGGWVRSKRHAIGFGDDTGRLVEGEVVCELGPRSIRPRGSRGAAGMLRLVSILYCLKRFTPGKLMKSICTDSDIRSATLTFSIRSYLSPEPILPQRIGTSSTCPLPNQPHPNSLSTHSYPTILFSEVY